MDDELMGWIIKFVECCAVNNGSNLTGVHQIFEKYDSRILQPQFKQDANQHYTINRIKDPEESKSNFQK
jgi:hypothetical protein